MKKMLIVEEPDSCETCPLRSYSNLMLMCTPMREAASDVECPLRPLPKKDDGKLSGYCGDWGCGYADGWNTCLDKIMGETE